MRVLTCCDRLNIRHRTVMRRPSTHCWESIATFARPRRSRPFIPDLAVVGSGYSWLQAFAFQAGSANVTAGKKCCLLGSVAAPLAHPISAAVRLRGLAAGPQETLPHFQLLYGPHEIKAQRIGQFATGCPPFDKEIYGPIWSRRSKLRAAAEGMIHV